MPVSPPGFAELIATGLVLVVVVVLIVVAVVVAARVGTRPPTGERRSGEALRELDLRYARGEIDRDEYLQRRSDLEGR